MELHHFLSLDRSLSKILHACGLLQVFSWTFNNFSHWMSLCMLWFGGKAASTFWNVFRCRGWNLPSFVFMCVKQMKQKDDTVVQVLYECTTCTCISSVCLVDIVYRVWINNKRWVTVVYEDKSCKCWSRFMLCIFLFFMHYSYVFLE